MVGLQLTNRQKTVFFCVVLTILYLVIIVAADCIPYGGYCGSDPDNCCGGLYCWDYSCTTFGGLGDYCAEDGDCDSDICEYVSSSIGYRCSECRMGNHSSSTYGNDSCSPGYPCSCKTHSYGCSSYFEWAKWSGYDVNGSTCCVDVECWEENCLPAQKCAPSGWDCWGAWGCEEGEVCDEGTCVTTTTTTTTSTTTTTTTTSITTTTIPLWWPEPIINLTETNRNDDWITFKHIIRWNSSNLQNLKNLDLKYQWELRRPDTPDVWDYWEATYPSIPSSGCRGSYYTDLPDVNDIATEEHEGMIECPWVSYPLGQDNEEFELFSTSTKDKIEADRAYMVYVQFKRKVRNEIINVTVESEACSQLFSLACTYPLPGSIFWTHPHEIKEVYS